MIWRLVVIVLFGASPALAQGALPADFYGDWQGATLTTNESGGIEATPADLNVQIEPDDSGFRMQWTGFTQENSDAPLVRTTIEARFAPTDRQGVFAFNPEQSSMLLRLFGDPSTNNPLEGEPLLWARLGDKTLSVYGLVIDDRGGFDLYQHVRELTGDSMMARYSLRTEHGVNVTLEGQLQRVGG